MTKLASSPRWAFQVLAEQFLPLTLVAVAAGVVWRSALAELATLWQTDPNCSHGPLVVIGALAFAVMAGRQHGVRPVRQCVSRSETATGIVSVVLGLVLHLAAWFVASLLLDVASLVVVGWGVATALGGNEARRVYRFPIAFLLFAAPLPVAWHQAAATSLQSLVAAVATGLLHLSGVAAFRTGNVIALPNYALEVGQACSGLRQLAALVALAAAIGFVAGRGGKFVTALVLLSVPVAVVANCLRAVMTGLIVAWLGPEWAQGAYHTLEGLCVVALAAGLLIGLAWLMARCDCRAGRETPPLS